MLDDLTKKLCAYTAVFSAAVGIAALVHGLHLIYPPLAWIALGGMLILVGLVGIDHYA